MRRLLVAGLLALSLLQPSTAQTGQAEFERAIASSLDSVYMLGVARRGGGGPEVFQLIGTGWVIAEGKLATNAHVAESLLETASQGRLVAKRSWSDRDELALSASSIRIHPAYGPWNARLKRVVVRNENDPNGARSMNFIPIADVAIVEVEAGETAAPLVLADPTKVEPLLSEAVVYLGFPHENISGFPTLHAVPGHVTAKTDFFFQRAPWSDSYLIHYCGPVVGGASGSPMLNRAGQVIGLISAAENNLSANNERTSFGFAYGQRADLALELLRDDFDNVQAQRNGAWSQRLTNLLIAPDALLEQLALGQASKDGVAQLASTNTVTRKQVVVKQSESAKLQVTLEPGLRYGFLAAAHDGSDVDAQLLRRDNGEQIALDTQIDYFPCLWVGPVDERVAVTFEIVASERLLGDTACTVHVYKYEPQAVAPESADSSLFLDRTYEHSGLAPNPAWFFEVEEGAQFMLSGESPDNLDIDLVLLRNGEIVASDESGDAVPMIVFKAEVGGRYEMRLRVPSGAATGAAIALKGLTLAGAPPTLVAGPPKSRADLLADLERFMAEVWRTTKMEGQTVVEDVVFVETSTDIALEVPANLVPVFVALSPTGEPLAIEVLLGGEVIARSEPDAMPPVAALTATDAPRNLTLRLIGSNLPAVPFRLSTVRPQ